MNIKKAKSVAFGSTPAESLEEYYEAWQFLYDANTLLRESDYYYLWRLIEAGYITGEPDKINWTDEMGPR